MSAQLRSASPEVVAPAAASTPRVFIIVLNWNGLAVTRDCLESLRKLQYANFHVVVVDNGSTDGSPDKLSGEFPEITLICNSENRGFTGGNNQGVQHALEAGADYILLLNNDTVVAPDFLDELIRVGESAAAIGLLNPKIYFFDRPTRIWYGGGSFGFWAGVARHWRYRREDRGGRVAPEEVTFVTGCAFLIKAEVVRKIGVLDETLFYSCEDTDWSLRALRAGYRAFYVPTAVIWHKESYDVKNNAGRAFRDYYNVRNSLLIARKYLRLYHWPTFALRMAYMLARRTAAAVLRREPARLKALNRGFWSGCTTPLRLDESQQAAQTK